MHISYTDDKLPQLRVLVLVLLCICVAVLLAFSQLNDAKRFRSIFSMLNMAASSGPATLSANPPPTVAPRPAGRTLVATTLLPEDLYQCAASAAKLIEAIKRSGAPPAADFVVLDVDAQPAVDPPLARVLHAFGWTVLPLPALTPPGSPLPGALPRAADLAPLHLWNLTRYDRVVFLASDCFVAGSLNELMELDLGAHPVWIAPAAGRGAAPGAVDPGVLVLRPDAGDFARLRAAAARGGGEGGDGAPGLAAILGEVFRGRRGELGFGNNADVAVFMEDRARWDRAREAGLNVVRYTSPKPWRCGGEYAEVCRLWEGLPIEEQCEVTLVTSYFVLESKHSPDEYREWMRSVLSLDACMVVVTSPSTVALFRGRDLRYTRLIELELDEAGMRLNRTVQFWEDQLGKDIERFRHKSYKLYWVWALKSIFLEDAIRSNVFRSQYFFWIDVGCLRDRTYDGRALRTVPPQVRQYDSVFFSNVADFGPEDLRLQADDTAANIYFSDHLAGAIWGGKATAVLSFHQAYFKVFSRLADSGAFVGKDQTIMNIVCVEQKGLCMMVRPREEVYNIWFYMVPFLLGDTPNDIPYSVGPA